MRLQQGTRRINEKSKSRLTVTFLDADRAPDAPTSARYRIDDITGGTREILDWTAIASPTATEEITVTATQNRILDASNEVETRQVTVEATGSDSEPYRQAFVYEIQNIPGTE